MYHKSHLEHTHLLVVKLVFSWPSATGVRVCPQPHLVEPGLDTVKVLSAFVFHITQFVQEWRVFISLALNTFRQRQNGHFEGHISKFIFFNENWSSSSCVLFSQQKFIHDIIYNLYVVHFWREGGQRSIAYWAVHLNTKHKYMNTVNHRYITVEYYMILKTARKGSKRNFTETKTKNSEKTPHTSPFRASRGVSPLNSLQKIHSEISREHCTLSWKTENHVTSTIPSPSGSEIAKSSDSTVIQNNDTQKQLGQ